MEKGSDEYKRFVKIIISLRLSDEINACQSMDESDEYLSKNVYAGVFCGTKI